MPRVIPKRQRKSEPLQGAATVMRPNGTAVLRATEKFSCEGVLFEKGTVVSPNSELARAILRDYPGFLEVVS